FRAAWREYSDLQFALMEAGLGRISRASGAVVIHPVRPAPWGVSLRQQRKTFWDALLYKKHPGLYRSRVRPRPPWDYYAAVASLAMAAGLLAVGHPRPAVVPAVVWAALTVRFC